ncbi:unnamed protein product [Peronospora destructor]|uniref:Uncharacterized protein n=1 Tax=Peronospora destructor TaxID=86335 RepID=A0AAV0T6B2_9STRA|nr:unnamed protein product [Peronospora destructor]
MVLLRTSANESLYFLPSSRDGSTSRTDHVTREEISAHQQQSIHFYVYVLLGVVGIHAVLLYQAASTAAFTTMQSRPAKRECLMCGTSEAPSATKSCELSTSESAESQATLVARNRSFHVRPLNEMSLNQQQRVARRRRLWQRETNAANLPKNGLVIKKPLGPR